MELSANFTLAELMKSQTALGIVVKNYAKRLDQKVPATIVVMMAILQVILKLLELIIMNWLYG